jgi:AcrR family transcriptional regulator
MDLSDVSGVKSRVTDEALVERRRAQIIAAAIELFARQGFYRTTMQEVARKAGVSAGLIYQYVTDKEDVLLLALLSILDSYREEIPRALAGLEGPLERWLAAVRAYCRVVNERRAVTVLAYRSTKSLPEDRRHLVKKSELESNDLLATCLRDCVEAGLARPCRVEVVTYQVVAFAHAWALKHWRLRDLCTLEEYLEEGLELFARGLLTPRGLRQYRALQVGGRPPRRAPGKGRR